MIETLTGTENFLEIAELVIRRDTLLLEKASESIEKRIFKKKDKNGNDLIYTPISERRYRLSEMVLTTFFDKEWQMISEFRPHGSTSSEDPENLMADGYEVAGEIPSWNEEKEVSLQAVMQSVEEFYELHGEPLFGREVFERNIYK